MLRKTIFAIVLLIVVVVLDHQLGRREISPTTKTPHQHSGKADSIERSSNRSGRPPSSEPIQNDGKAEAPPNDLDIAMEFPPDPPSEEFFDAEISEKGRDVEQPEFAVSDDAGELNDRLTSQPMSVDRDTPVLDPVVVPGVRRADGAEGPAAPIFRRGLGVSQPSFAQSYPPGRIAGRADYRGVAKIYEGSQSTPRLQPTQVAYRDLPNSPADAARNRKTGRFAAAIHDNARDGEWLYHQVRGERLIERAEYRGNQRNGIWRQWYVDGQKQSEETYVAGQLEGQRRTWHPNGRLESVVSYRQGERDGLATFWDSGGMMLARQHFAQGRQLDGERMPIPVPQPGFAALPSR